MNVKAKNKGTMEFNPVLDIFMRSNPFLIWGIFLPTSAYLLYRGYTTHDLSVIFSIGMFAVGILGWTLFEYVMHRYLFHFATDNPSLKKFFYYAHGIHHEFPRDKDHLFLPPVISVVLAIVLFYTFQLMMGDAVYAFFPGFVIGYLLYGTMHYCIHAFNPPFKFMKPLWRYHHVHHYADHDRGFGVSSPLWDYVFGTVPKDVKELKSKS